ncbi:hypothetical protein BDF14DRAFT_1775320 [Spinellus fusiger]|nr:hypothetical protein BDF14DRAFT_1775320 [Spinellus fusiger]
MMASYPNSRIQSHLPSPIIPSHSRRFHYSQTSKNHESQSIHSQESHTASTFANGDTTVPYHYPMSVEMDIPVPVSNYPTAPNVSSMIPLPEAYVYQHQWEYNTAVTPRHAQKTQQASMVPYDAPTIKSDSPDSWFSTMSSRISPTQPQPQPHQPQQPQVEQLQRELADSRYIQEQYKMRIQQLMSIVDRQTKKIAELRGEITTNKRASGLSILTVSSP